jgi:hypothetical protein
LGVTIGGEFYFKFKTGSELPTISLPSYVKFVNDFNLYTNTTYEISILDGKAIVLSYAS